MQLKGTHAQPPDFAGVFAAFVHATNSLWLPADHRLVLLVPSTLVCYDHAPPVLFFLAGRSYSAYDLSGKAACKRALQREMRLPQDPELPVIGFIGRLDYQKGPDLLLDALPILANLDCQVRGLRSWPIPQNALLLLQSSSLIVYLSPPPVTVLLQQQTQEAASPGRRFQTCLLCCHLPRSWQVVMLGSGAPDYEARLREATHEFGWFCRGHVGFSVPLSHKIIAGCDILIMPSRCGQHGSSPACNAV